MSGYCIVLTLYSHQHWRSTGTCTVINIYTVVIMNICEKLEIAKDW